MSKKIEKEFWVSQGSMNALKQNKLGLHGHLDMGNISLGETNVYVNKVKISWEEPEKTITLSESEFDEILTPLQIKRYGIPDGSYPLPGEIVSAIKQKLFSKRDA